MLGRKQSLKGEPILADYGPEESLNESADIEWVNKVRKENVAGKLRYSIAGNDNIGRNFFFRIFCCILRDVRTRKKQ